MMKIFHTNHRLLLHRLLLAAYIGITLFSASTFLPMASAQPAGVKPIVLLEPLPNGVREIMKHTEYVEPLIPWAMGVAAGLAVFMIVVGGMQMMISDGNQAGMDAGKKRMLSAILGLLILVFSATILIFLNSLAFTT